MTDAPVKKQTKGYVGFSNLPNQVHRKSLKKGFTFTLMVVGESGLGKSTLVNSVFNANLYPPKEEVEPSSETPQTMDLQVISSDIEENGVMLTLNIIDTPGFGDFLNNEDSWKPILQNIEARNDAYLDQENRINRSKIVDNRIHACIYFIPPTGHSLRPIDIEFMSRLHERVNLIPVIAKSDTLTEKEIKGFKQRILDDLNHHQIRIFSPSLTEYDDPETIEESKELVSKMPFAVVGSMKLVEVGGKRVRGRQYPWGVVEVDNEDHCDFIKLRQMLIRSHMEELKEYTAEVLYENYRTKKLLEQGYQQDDSIALNPLSKLENEKVAHEQKLARMEAEMKLVFQQKVAEKEAKLRQSEDDLYAKHAQMKDALERQRAELEEKKRRLESSTPEKGRRKGGLFK